MKTNKTRKALSIVLAFLMLITALPFAAMPTKAAAPTVKAYISLPVNSLPDHHAYRASIVTATFLNYIDEAAVAQSGALNWNIAADGSGSVKSWLLPNSENPAMYDLYIGGDGGITANANSTNFFYNFTALKEVKGLEYFDTSSSTNISCFFEECASIETLDLRVMDVSSAKDLSYFFSGCKSLVSVNLSNWDTSNATNMAFMFANCSVLSVLDISSFDTRNVTSMKRLFYKAESLSFIYVGDNWSIANLTSYGRGEIFNCCYALVGTKEEYDTKFQYGHPTYQYADLTYADTFLTYKAPETHVEYAVKYEVSGDVPAGYTVPETLTYTDGSKIKVADAPYADGYVFSGWTPVNTTVDAEGNFTVDKEITFTGTWKKLYNVTYVYTEGYEVPDGAPVLPAGGSYTAGEAVAVSDIPFVDGYIFVGWTTEDASVSDNSFMMPEKDVVLHGYFKKPVESVEINGELEEITITKDESGDEDATYTIHVTVLPEGATFKEIVAETSDGKVVEATVTDNNTIVITAKGEGTATVTIYSKDDESKNDSVTVTVVIKEPVTDFEVDKDKIILNKGEAERITATVGPENATNKKVIYESKDESIVTVDENGNVTATEKTGETVIYAYPEDNPSLKVEIPVTVKNPVTEIYAPDEITVKVGETVSINAEVNDDATNKELTYITDDKNTAHVDLNGEITGLKPGTTTLIITSVDDPDVVKAVTVKVIQPVEKVEIKNEASELEIGDEIQLEVYVDPDDATDGSVTYESSDDKVITVDENGKITAAGEGTATITVTSVSDPTKKDTIEITVKKPFVPVKDVEIKNEVTEPVEIGDEIQLEVNVNPDNATGSSVTYESSDDKVITVDENGKVTATGEGTATITVTSVSDPTKKDTIVITVKAAESEEPDVPVDPEIPEEPEKPTYTITLPESISVDVGVTTYCGLDIKPQNNTIKPVFTSADESIAKVDEYGNITGVAAGTTTITVNIEGEIRILAVTVIGAAEPDAPVVPGIPRTHYICFGKTDGIGWYEVSINGGDFFAQGPNSTLEVEEGSILVVRVQDMWIDDEFDFYVNGNKVEPDAANTIVLTVDGYMLIGALSMDVEVPDVDESLTLLQRIKNAFKSFFDWIANLFKR